MLKWAQQILYIALEGFGDEVGHPLYMVKYETPDVMSIWGWIGDHA